jgi:hypothetical protein
MLAWLSAALMQLTACWLLPVLTQGKQLVSLPAAAAAAAALCLQDKQTDVWDDTHCYPSAQCQHHPVVQ